ncbi:hypothetical protein IW248_004827 [Micromonospora ureilytica]|uniref:Uncharacterized protein n=1 Tax=Micromonospora ureilytica TaxID=709868 RepID=A0ABS0JNA3_9ACTN|nr:hypothetical protein [Micromonospora ureilytica]
MPFDVGIGPGSVVAHFRRPFDRFPSAGAGGDRHRRHAHQQADCRSPELPSAHRRASSWSPGAVTVHRRRACGSAPGSAHPEPFIALLHSPLRIFYKSGVLCRPMVKVRLASHPRGEHRLTLADTTEAIQANTLRDDRWWWRVSTLRPGQWSSELSLLMGRRRAGWARRSLATGRGSGTSRPHPGIRTGLSADRRVASPSSEAVESTLAGSGGQVGFCAIRNTIASVQSRSVFAIVEEHLAAREGTWR